MDDDRTQEEVRGEEQLACALSMLQVDALPAVLQLLPVCPPKFPQLSMLPCFTMESAWYGCYNSEVRPHTKLCWTQGAQTAALPSHKGLD